MCLSGNLNCARHSTGSQWSFSGKTREEEEDIRAREHCYCYCICYEHRQSIDQTRWRSWLGRWTCDWRSLHCRVRPGQVVHTHCRPPCWNSTARLARLARLARQSRTCWVESSRVEPSGIWAYTVILIYAWLIQVWSSGQTTLFSYYILSMHEKKHWLNQMYACNLVILAEIKTHSCSQNSWYCYSYFIVTRQLCFTAISATIENGLWILCVKYHL